MPVIASGGAGSMAHFKEVFDEGNADAALAASIFHYKEIAIPELKQYLQQQNVIVRCDNIFPMGANSYFCRSVFLLFS